MKINLLLAFFCLNISYSNNLSAQKMYSSLYESWNNNGWEKQMLQSYGYDANMVNTSYLQSNWSDSSWIPDRKIIYNVNAAGNQTSSATQLYNNSTNTWTNQSQSIRTYTSNYLLNEIEQDWNGVTYVNSSNFTNAYSNTYKLLSSKTESWSGNSWQNAGMQSYSYTSGGTMTLILYQYWIPSVSTWSNTLSATNIYSLGLLTQQVYQNWTSSGWQNWTRYRNSYDSNSFADTMYADTWSGTQWQPSLLYTHKPDAAGNSTLTTQYTWNSSGNSWSPFGRWTYVYDETKKTGLDENARQISEFSLYPVPTIKMLSIRFESDFAETPFTIFDSKGDMVMRGILAGQNAELDVSNLSSGVYIISCGSASAPKKFIKE